MARLEYFEIDLIIVIFLEAIILLNLVVDSLELLSTLLPRDWGQEASLRVHVVASLRIALIPLLH